MAELSPAAQAVFDAWVAPARLSPKRVGKGAKQSLCQAFRALAYQVVPANGSCQNDEIRAKILAIVAELENTND